MMRLSGKIHGPVGMCFDVTDRACATIVEKMLPVNRMLGFVTECDEDDQFAKRELNDRLGLKLDFYKVVNLEIDRRKIYSDREMADIASNLNVQGWVIDSVQCSDLIRYFLQWQAGLNRALWARDRPDKRVDLAKFMPPGFGPRTFTFYMHETQNLSSDAGGDITEYVGKRSHYAQNSAPSTSISQIFPKGVLLCSTGGGGDEVAERRALLEGNILNLRKHQTALNNTSKGLQERIRGAHGELNELRAEKQHLVRAQKYPSEIVNKVIFCQQVDQH